MKYLFLILLLIPSLLYAQSRNEETKKIDELVNKINKSAAASSSQLNSSGRNYTYTQAHGKIIYIAVKYKIDSTDYEEQYYLEKENLIYAKFTEITYYKKEGITWAGEFYFSNYKLIYYETLGHGRSEKDDWDPEKEVLKKYDLRINELRSKMK